MEVRKGGVLNGNPDRNTGGNGGAIIEGEAHSPSSLGCVLTTTPESLICQIFRADVLL